MGLAREYERAEREHAAHCGSPLWFGPRRDRFSPEATEAAANLGLSIVGTGLDPSWLGRYVAAAIYDDRLLADRVHHGRRGRPPECAPEVVRTAIAERTAAVISVVGSTIWWSARFGGIWFAASLSVASAAASALASCEAPDPDAYAESVTTAGGIHVDRSLRVEPERVEYPHRRSATAVTFADRYADLVVARWVGPDVAGLQRRDVARWLLAAQADRRLPLATLARRNSAPPAMRDEDPESMLDDESLFAAGAIPGHVEYGCYYHWDARVEDQFVDAASGWDVHMIPLDGIQDLVLGFVEDRAVVRPSRVVEDEWTSGPSMSTSFD